MSRYRSVSAVDGLPLVGISPRNDTQETVSGDPRKPGDPMDLEHAHTSSTAGLIANPPSSSRSLRAPLPSYFFQDWEWELITWTLGSAAMACIVVLLLKFQNKPLSHWHSEVSIAAMVASLSQIAQSALMAPVASCIGQLKWRWFQKGRRTYDVDIYDEASRGPAGSLWILLTTKPQLVTLGALVTLFMLLFPTFVQQALGTNLQLLDRNGTSTFATALNYTADSRPAPIFMEGYNSPESLAAGESYDPYMISTIKSGMIDRYRSLSNISAPCPTTYCTWQNYSTLAVCSSVEEVSNDIYEYNINDTIVPSLPHYTLRQLDARQPTIVRQNQGDYDFLVASLSYKNPFGHSTTNTTDGRMPDMANIFTLFHDPCLPSGREGTHDYAYNASTFRAFKGTLRLCVQTLDSTFNNTMNTTVVMTHDDLVWQKTNVTSAEGLEAPHSLCTSLGVDNQPFCVQEDPFLKEVGWQILHQFNSSGHMGGSGGDSYIDGNQWTQNLLSDVLGLNPTECSNETGIGMEGFTARIENMAIAMTNAMRVANSSSEITGTAWSTVQIIHINFLWLIYPLCTHISATIFILITVVSTRRQRLPTWKNSALALLRSADQDNQVSSRKDMRNAAKRSTLRFVPRGPTWRLEENSSHMP